MARTKQHIRRPDLPWRRLDITECGRPSQDGDLTREQGIKAVREVIKSRGGSLWMTEGAPKSPVCETCMGQLSGSRTWDANPAAVVHREIERLSAQWQRPSTPAAHLLHLELRAIAQLIEAHREEFEGLIGEPKFVQAWSALASFLQDELRTKRRSG